MNPFLLTRAAVSAAALVSLIATSDLEILVTVTAGLYLVFLIVQGTGPWIGLAGATLLMVLPLFLVHGIVNPTFASSASFHGIPWRSDGASYAALVGLRMALLFVVVGIWMGLQRSVTLALVAGSQMPAMVGLVLLQALLLSRVLARRVTKIRLAQKSRGLLRNGNLRQKATSAIAMVVPLIATTLMDAHDRGDAFARMGVGAARIVPPHPLQMPGTMDIALACAVSFATLAVTVQAVFHVHQ